MHWEMWLFNKSNNNSRCTYVCFYLLCITLKLVHLFTSNAKKYIGTLLKPLTNYISWPTMLTRTCFGFFFTNHPQGASWLLNTISVGCFFQVCVVVFLVLLLLLLLLGMRLVSVSVNVISKVLHLLIVCIFVRKNRETAYIFLTPASNSRQITWYTT